jgi:uncharacterized coiled-coil DUF342 family protein
LEQELDKAAENFKTERDKLNEMVQDHKSKRQQSYSESKELRKQFMSHLNKKKSMEHIPMEVLILTKQIDQLEWEIQTEAVDVDTEKKLVKQIQDNIEKLHNYANMYKDHEDVSKAVRSLTSELSKKLAFAEGEHQEMIKAVDKSDKYHKDFVESVMKLRDARTKRIAFQRDVERHKKAIEHWRTVADKESKKQPETKTKQVSKTENKAATKNKNKPKKPPATESKPKSKNKTTTPAPETKAPTPTPKPPAPTDKSGSNNQGGEGDGE